MNKSINNKTKESIQKSFHGWIIHMIQLVWSQSWARQCLQLFIKIKFWNWRDGS